MKVSGWGNYPVIDSDKLSINSLLIDSENDLSESNDIIARGMGRSYGDSSLSKHIYDMTERDRFLSFDSDSGRLRCEAGVGLDKILDTFVPRGWFLPVTPGTKYVTVGGAIASDIHGKNHHESGCFSEYVDEVSLMLPNGDIISCSKLKNSELFKATCGGMGLTGIILEATFRLKKISNSTIQVQLIKASNLQECFDLFEKHKDWPYSVAWLDCLATGDKLGRSILMLGKHARKGSCKYKESQWLDIPAKLPSWLVNKHSISLFNSLYYRRFLGRETSTKQTINSFFYPLDIIGNWNRLYGKNGFLQYQFVLPIDQSYRGLEIILQEISKSGMGSFLSVLKLMGTQNENYLSFPMEGYTLALDFKITDGLFHFLNKLDDIVVKMGGRIYLTKDARMSEQVFKESYSRYEQFDSIRKQIGAKGVFESLQSQRLNI